MTVCMTILPAESLILIAWGIWYTLIICFFTLTLGTVGGVGLCALRLSKKPWHNAVAKYFIMLLRGIPASVLLLLLFYVVFQGWNPLWAAIVCFIIRFACHSADVFCVSYNAVDPKQYVAARSLGMSGYQSFRYVVLPQMLKNCTLSMKDRVGGIIKATSIVGYIAIVDLTKAVDLITSEDWHPLIPILIVGTIYFCLTRLGSTLVDYVFKKFY